MLNQEISRHWISYQRLLFPDFEKIVGPLTDPLREVVLVLDVLRLERCFNDGPSSRTGRRPVSRLVLARCFVAKTVLNLPTTTALMDRLNIDAMLRRIVGFSCVREIPSPGTFSNAFAEFAQSHVLERLHEMLVGGVFKERLVGHVCRDATSVAARERISADPGAQCILAKGKQGRPKKNEARVTLPKTRIEKQLTQSLDEMLAELPCVCDCGSKRGSRGYPEHWFGYKLHMDVDDNGIPLSCLLTSASLNDSQVAIPLESMTHRRVTSLYTLMDKGYDADGIRRFVRSLGKVPISQMRRWRGKSRQEVAPMDPASVVRIRQRTVVERAFSQIKDNLGGRNVRVRGGQKVMAHIMFGVLSLTAFGVLALTS